mmetsp:Transcript_3104/g.10743  ORF Transcript_3104/g.10743 Transcript_3104/m.10743 type:complete len:310 (-) Transcript_3104:592-1521(-)
MNTHSFILFYLQHPSAIVPFAIPSLLAPPPPSERVEAPHPVVALVYVLVVVLGLQIDHAESLVHRVLHHFGSHVLEGLLPRWLGVRQSLDEVVQGERPGPHRADRRGVLPLRLQELPDRVVRRVGAQLLEVRTRKPGGLLAKLPDSLAGVNALVHHFPLEHLAQDGLPLLLVRKADQEALRQPPQHSLVDLPRSVGRSQNHDLGVLIGSESVPKRHELRLHVVRGLVLVAVPLAEHRVDLVDEDDAWLELHGQGEDRRHQLLGVTKPLALQGGGPHVDEAGVGLLRDGLGEHGLPRPGGTVQEHPLHGL